MMPPSAFVNGSCAKATERVIRWYRRRVRESKTFSKEAKRPALRRKRDQVSKRGPRQSGGIVRRLSGFLRVRNEPIWDKNSREALFVRRLGAQNNATYIETRPAPTVANILVCLIHQTNYLLDQQLRQLEKAFLAEGGLRERMTRARIAARSAKP